MNGRSNICWFRLETAKRLCARHSVGVRAQKMDRREALSALVEWRGELEQLQEER